MSAAAVASDAAASTWGLVEVGDSGSNLLIHDVGGGVIDGSLWTIKDGIFEESDAW